MTNDFFKKYPFSETLEYLFNQVALVNSKNDFSLNKIINLGNVN